MSSGRGQSPCDTDPRKLRPDAICSGAFTIPFRRNDCSGFGLPRAGRVPERADLVGILYVDSRRKEHPPPYVFDGSSDVFTEIIT